jgi:hypothetical protein
MPPAVFIARRCGVATTIYSTPAVMTIVAVIVAVPGDFLS